MNINLWKRIKNLSGVILNEFYAGYEYQPPEDREEQLFDFYSLNYYWSKRDFITDEGMKFSFEYAGNKLLNNLKDEMLQDVFFAIATELPHVYDENTIDEMRDFTKELGIEKYHKNFEELYHGKYPNYEAPKLSNKNIEKSKEKLKSYFGMEELSKRYAQEDINDIYLYHIVTESFKGLSKEQIVNIAKKYFTQLKWDEGYGGKPWANICDTWIELNSSVGYEDIMIWIDHIYDIEHNTDSLLSKLNRYYKETDNNWLKNSLNFKKNIKDPKELFEKCSASFKGFMYAVARNIERATI